jgi:phasin
MAIAPKKPAVPLALAPVALAPQPIAAPAPVVADSAPSITEFPGAVRASVEKSLEQSRAAYAKAKLVADESAAALETSYAAARAGVAAINAKAFETLRANVEANFDFLKSSFAAASLADYVELQGEFARKQMDAVADQTKEIGALAQKATLDAVQPIKAQVAKAFSLSH